MDGRKRNVDPYDCVFDHNKGCQVRTTFKLKPESLVKFCKICPTKGMDEKASAMEAVVEAAVPKMTEAIMTFFREEREQKQQLSEIIKTLSEKLTK